MTKLGSKINILRSVYCDQYRELKQNGKEQRALENRTRILTISVAFNVISIVVIFMVISENFAYAFGDLIEDIFGRKTGRSIGRFIAFTPFLIRLPQKVTFIRLAALDKLSTNRVAAIQAWEVDLSLALISLRM